VRQDYNGRFAHPNLARRENAAVPGDDDAIVSDQHGVDEPELGD
jgi:hypothetical protein